MKRRVEEANINTKQYLDTLYSDESWKAGYAGAIERLELDISLINTFYPRHLDVGCADGIFTKRLIEKYPDSKGWGIDLSEEVIKNADNNVVNCFLSSGDCYNLPFPDQSFDLVHSAELIEHLEFPEKAITEMDRVLRPGGTLILTTINQYATRYEEHLWEWDYRGVLEMFDDFEIQNFQNKFFNEHCMRIEATKYD